MPSYPRAQATWPGHEAICRLYTDYGKLHALSLPSVARCALGIPEIFTVTSGLVTQDLASTRPQSNDPFYSLKKKSAV